MLCELMCACSSMRMPFAQIPARLLAILPCLHLLLFQQYPIYRVDRPSPPTGDHNSASCSSNLEDIISTHHLDRAYTQLAVKLLLDATLKTQCTAN